MALQTQGFRVDAPPIPTVPANIGKVDVASIYDSVVKGLQTAEALRTTPARQSATDQILGQQAEQAKSERAIIPARQSATLATLDADLQAEQNRRTRERTIGALSGPQQVVAAKEGFPLASTINTTRLPDGRVSTEATKTATVGGEVVPVSNSSNEGLFAMIPGIPAQIANREALYTTFSPEERANADRVAAGLKGRASGAGMQHLEATLPDGTTQVFTFDPKTGGYFPAQVAQPATAPLASTQPAAAPAAAAAQSAPTELKSPTIGAAEAQKAGAQEQAKLQAERQAKLPKAQASLATLEQKTALVDQTIEEARQLVGPFTVGYGSMLERLPQSDARALKAKIDTIRANIGFDALQEMRQNSPTGGALGNVSDYEGQTLQGTLAKLDTGLDIKSFLEALDRVKQARQQTVARVRQAYEQDFNLAKEGGLPNPGAFSQGGALVQPNAAPAAVQGAYTIKATTPDEIRAEAAQAKAQGYTEIITPDGVTHVLTKPNGK